MLMRNYFYRAAWNADAGERWEFCLSVRPSVCLSVCHTRDPWQNGREICPDFYTIRKNIYPSFWEKEWLVGATPSTWNFGSTDPRWSEIADFQPIIVRSSSAVTPSEKSSIKANRKSTTRFPMSLRRSSYVAPKSPKGGLKNAKRPISITNALRLKKVCYRVSLCENCQRKSCKAFIGLTNRAKIVDGGATPCTWNLGSKWPRWCRIDFRAIFARSASAVTPVWKLSGQSCKAFIGLTIGAKIIGGDDPFYLKFWVKVTAFGQNARHFILTR